MIRSLLLLLSLASLLGAQVIDPRRPLPRPEPEKAPPAQPFGNLRVTVLNPKKAPLAEALVSIPELKRSFPTEEDGTVLLSWVPIGKHAVAVSKRGFKTRTLPVEIEPEKTRALEVILEPDSK